MHPSIQKKKFRLAEGVVSRRDSQGNVLALYNPFNDSLLELNSSAGEIVRFLTGEYSVEEIVTRLSNEYETDVSEIEQDVSDLIRRLIELEAIV